MTLVIAAVAVLILHSVSAARTGKTTGGNVPASAQASIRLLLSARGRHALTPELDEILHRGELFPAGTTFTATPGTWHQARTYANVTGMLRVPGRSPVRAEIGLVHRGGHWLVTFEASQ